MKKQIILVIGACGQIGAELTIALSGTYGRKNVIAADIHAQCPESLAFENYLQLDVLDKTRLEQTVIENEVTQVYLLAAMLSATGERHKEKAWQLNVQSLLSVLELARAVPLDKVFWPSSIAVFGPDSPKYNCHQFARMEPRTVYGISKRAGEFWCNYYADQYDIDVRSLRYPGLISWKAALGGGTTDYAVEIFHAALEHRPYTCYLSEDNCLPMMYMDDATRATLELMEAPKEQIKTRLAYNLAAMSFAPCDLAAAIRKYIPGFRIQYEPDARDVIAKSWPASISDQQARADWGWKPEFDLKRITLDMLERLSVSKNLPLPEIDPGLIAYPDFVDGH